MSVSLNKKLYLLYPFLFKWQDQILPESLSLFLLAGETVEKDGEVS